MKYLLLELKQWLQFLIIALHDLNLTLRTFSTQTLILIRLYMLSLI
jgi:hypothetical protein